MKAKNFTMYVTILMMVAATTAAGQPSRGEKNGNHENKSRKELKSAARNERRGNRNIHFNTQNNDRVRPQERVLNNTAVRRESKAYGHNAGKENYRSGNDRRSYSESWHSENNREIFNKELPGRRDHKGYADRRPTREIPAPDSREFNRNRWEDRNYDRHGWEHRAYNWDDHHWNFSNYYRRGYIPYYFRNNHNYWFYPPYGHILRGFSHHPFIFYSGRIPFYFEDGFFYRYYNGIGYVWIEDPYNLYFNELPYGAVRVNINGRIYFRLGNAFFEAGSGGFHLALLPDRYYDTRVSLEVSAGF